MSVKNKLFGFESIKLIVVGLFILAIVSFRDGCGFFQSNEKPNANDSKKEKTEQIVSHSSRGNFVAIRSSNIYVKPNITSKTYYKINKGAKIYVEKIDEWNYFYTYKERGEIKGYVLKDDFRRAD